MATSERRNQRPLSAADSTGTLSDVLGIIGLAGSGERPAEFGRADRWRTALHGRAHQLVAESARREIGQRRREMSVSASHSRNAGGYRNRRRPQRTGFSARRHGVHVSEPSQGE